MRYNQTQHIFSMNPLALIEKLITEHGSAAILKENLAFARDQFADLERKVSELQTQIGRLEAHLERECSDHDKAKQDLQRLIDEHAEEVRIHSAIEFRRGKRTGGVWMPFCPKCHMPVHDPDLEIYGIACSGDCGWMSRYNLAWAEGISKKLE